MELKTEIKISPGLLKLGDRIHAGIQAGLLRAAGAVEARAVEEAPRVTGNLVDAIRKYIEGSRARISATAPYSIFVHEGTGLYGPLKRKIFPKEKKALAFVYGGKQIVVRSTKGQKPNPFMARALEKVKPPIAEIINQAIRDFVEKG